MVLLSAALSPWLWMTLLFAVSFITPLLFRDSLTSGGFCLFLCQSFLFFSVGQRPATQLILNSFRVGKLLEKYEHLFFKDGTHELRKEINLDIALICETVKNVDKTVFFFANSSDPNFSTIPPSPGYWRAWLTDWLKSKHATNCNIILLHIS